MSFVFISFLSLSFFLFSFFNWLLYIIIINNNNIIDNEIIFEKMLSEILGVLSSTPAGIVTNDIEWGFEILGVLSPNPTPRPRIANEENDCW